MTGKLQAVAPILIQTAGIDVAERFAAHAPHKVAGGTGVGARAAAVAALAQIVGAAVLPVDLAVDLLQMPLFALVAVCQREAVAGLAVAGVVFRVSAQLRALIQPLMAAQMLAG